MPKGLAIAKAGVSPDFRDVAIMPA